MRLSLRSLVLAPVLVAAAALTPSLASAERLHVPFAFSVAGKDMPAGSYTVQRDTNGNLVTLASPDRKTSFSWILVPGDAGPNGRDVALRFEQTGSGYELQSIRYRSGVTPRINRKPAQNDDRAVHEIRGE